MVRRGGRGETKMVLPSLSPCCLTSLPAPSSIQGGMSSVLHCPDSLCLWVQWHRALGRRGLRMVQGGDIKDRWGFVFPGPFCCLDWGIWCLLLLWVEWGGSCSYIHIFSIRTVLGSEQIHFYAYVQVACPPSVVWDQHVLHTPGRHSLWSLGRELLKQAAFFQISLFPKELVISSALYIPGRTKYTYLRW